MQVPNSLYFSPSSSPKRYLGETLWTWAGPNVLFHTQALTVEKPLQDIKANFSTDQGSLKADSTCTCSMRGVCSP